MPQIFLRQRDPDMFKILRMVSSILAAILVTACIFLGIYINLIACLGCAAGALLCFVLTLLFKYLQEEQEEKQRKAAPPEDAAAENEEKKSE